MSELDERVKRVQAEYEKAVKAKQIDPKKIDIERFADILADDVEYIDAPSLDATQERIDSEQNVANLMNRGTEVKQSILNRWFGKKD